MPRDTYRFFIAQIFFISHKVGQSLIYINNSFYKKKDELYILTDKLQEMDTNDLFIKFKCKIGG